ncbi:hypothetical protein FLACOL_01315 [Flavobacterium columnare]|uniref:Uncharacterized protein n=2 Tax=Flavobacterium TaxID=237 RepID=A0ABW8PLX7_9FLAO|nr:MULTISPECIES: hypothetical protein [Flavobacterium]QYS88591.1 hypothetical protein JJC05_13360 [Flavobacterium davisii]SPE77322.1 hypothetical protein FLACOL_01315 [Flavobacterium columnare]
MIYIIPTKRGIGVELWGNYEDFKNLYSFISQFWNRENTLTKEDFKNRDTLLSSFSYEIRKAKDGNRLTREANHFSNEKQEYLGCQFSWVHFIFSLTALKYNMRYQETTKYDISQILLIEFWLEKAMKNYDEIGSASLVGYIEGGIHGGNELIYQYMKSINLDFFLLGGGKKAFRKLPKLLQKGVFLTHEYNEYQKLLEEDAKRLNCKMYELEVNDDFFDYDKIKW